MSSVRLTSQPLCRWARSRRPGRRGRRRARSPPPRVSSAGCRLHRFQPAAAVVVLKLTKLVEREELLGLISAVGRGGDVVDDFLADRGDGEDIRALKPLELLHLAVENAHPGNGNTRDKRYATCSSYERLVQGGRSSRRLFFVY